jgi:carbonic anhydrase
MRTVEVVYRYAEAGAAAAEHPSDADSARRRLERGNQAFAALFDGVQGDGGYLRHVVSVDPRDLSLLPGGKERVAQRPFAAVLGCADARVPIELLFNEGPNDLFIVRIAGNILGAEVLGSLNYAIERLGGSLRLVVVLAHSGCGAVTAAVDVFLNPAGYLQIVTNHALRRILDNVLIVVQASSRKLAQIFGPGVTGRPGYREALIEASIAVNAALTAHTIRRDMAADTPIQIKTVYGVYLLESRRIWSPQKGAATWTGLAEAPGDSANFEALGDAIAHSSRIAAILKG